MVKDVGAAQAKTLVARSSSELGKAHDCHKPGPWLRGSNEHVIGGWDKDGHGILTDYRHHFGCVVTTQVIGSCE